jgi:hypothetical protein
VCPIVDPFARRRDPLTCCNGCGMADNGHDITMPARLSPQHAEAILSVMVCDALDETGKGLLRLILGRVFHTLNGRNAGSNIAACVSAAIESVAARFSGIERGTKLEPSATILLPKPVAAHDRGRYVTDGCVKIFKQNKTAQN